MEPQGTENSLAVRKLREWDAQAVAQVIEFRGETTVVVPLEQLGRTAEYLATEPSLRFSFLSDITAVDRYPIEPRFEVNYHLLSIERRDRLRLKVRVPGSEPVAPRSRPCGRRPTGTSARFSICSGYGFEGHPDLRRILMPEDWEGYPLRKDYPVEGYR